MKHGNAQGMRQTHVPREHLGQEARRAGQYVEYEAREQVGTREGGTRHVEHESWKDKKQVKNESTWNTRHMRKQEHMTHESCRAREHNGHVI